MSPAATPSQSGAVQAGAVQSGAVQTGTAPIYEPDPTLPGLGFAGVLRSELLKLLALRSTYWLSAITLLLSMLLAGVVAVSFSQWGGADMPEVLLAESAVAGLYFGQLLLGALAVISITTEYSSGAIRSSLTAVPRRNMLYLAKASAITVVLAVVTAVLLVVSHLVTVLFSGELELLAPFTNSEIGYIYAAHWVAVLLLGLLGFGLGALLRSSAGGIVVLTIIVFVLGIVVSIMYEVSQGADWAQWLMQAEFSSLMAQFTASDQFRELALWQAAGGLLIWTAVPFGLGWLSLHRRDA